MMSVRGLAQNIAALDVSLPPYAWTILGDILLNLDLISENEAQAIIELDIDFRERKKEINEDTTLDDSSKKNKLEKLDVLYKKNKSDQSVFFKLITDPYKLQEFITPFIKKKIADEKQLAQFIALLHTFISMHYFYFYHFTYAIAKHVREKNPYVNSEVLKRTLDQFHDINQKTVDEKILACKSALSAGREKTYNHKGVSFDAHNPTDGMTFSSVNHFRAAVVASNAEHQFDEDTVKAIADCAAELTQDFENCYVELVKLRQLIENLFYADYIIEDIESAYNFHHAELAERLGVPLQRRLEQFNRSIDADEVQKIIELNEKLSTQSSPRYAEAKVKIAETLQTLNKEQVISLPKERAPGQEKTAYVTPRINRSALDKNKNNSSLQIKLHDAAFEYATAVSNEICEKFIRGISQRIINTALSKDCWKVGLLGGIPLTIRTDNNQTVTISVPRHIAQIYRTCQEAMKHETWAMSFERLADIGLAASKPRTSFLWINKRDKKTSAFYNEFKALHDSAKNSSLNYIPGVLSGS